MYLVFSKHLRSIYFSSDSGKQAIAQNKTPLK